MFGALTNGSPVSSGDLEGRGFGEAGRCVDAGAHGRTSQRKAVHALQRIFHPLQIVGEHARIARPLLPERQRRGILHVGASDLDDVLPLFGLGGNRIVQRLHRRHQPLLHTQRRRNVHGRGKVIVGRLRHIDVVVGMNRRLAPQRRARKLAAAIGDHLIHIHVELRSAARHPYVQRKHVLMLAAQNFVADLDDQFVVLGLEPVAGMVGIGCGFLQDGVGADHLARHQVPAYAEVLQRTLGLGAPELAGANLYFPQAVGFLASIRHALSPSLFLLQRPVQKFTNFLFHG